MSYNADYFRRLRAKRRAEGYCMTHGAPSRAPCVRCRDYMRAMRAGKSRGERTTGYEQKRAYWLKSRFKISLAQWDAMLQSQAGRCAICGREDSGDKRARRFAVDHDHQSGVLRGLICTACNKAIGLLRDDPQICLAAAVYLERYQLNEATSR